MIQLFNYNWQVRDEWFELCKQIPMEELLRKRIGGPGCMLYTLFHIADVEYSWISGLQGKPDIQVNYKNFNTLEQVKELSDGWVSEIRIFLNTWSNEFENEMVTVPWTENRYWKGEILRHVIAHEIHHIGQLSIWAREIGIKPISPNFIGRGLLEMKS